MAISLKESLSYNFEFIMGFIKCKEWLELESSKNKSLSHKSELSLAFEILSITLPQVHLCFHNAIVIFSLPLICRITIQYWITETTSKMSLTKFKVWMNWHSMLRADFILVLWIMNVRVHRYILYVSVSANYITFNVNNSSLI